MGVIKHNVTNNRKPTKKAEPVSVVTAPDAASMQHNINHISGLADIESSLDWIARGLDKLTHPDNAVTVSVSQGSNTDPVQLTLTSNDYDDTLDRLVTAFERIADSVARLAGLNRPRLEQWHEQCEYEPRYRDTACDGGAPGPKKI